LPSFKWLKFLHPVMESMIPAGLPTVLSIFVLQVILGLKPPHEPPWVSPFCFAVLAVSIPIAFWWRWMPVSKLGR